MIYDIRISLFCLLACFFLIALHLATFISVHAIMSQVFPSNATLKIQVTNTTATTTELCRLGQKNTLIASLQSGKIPTILYSGYETKPSDGAIPVLELWGMESISSYQLLPVPLWSGVVVPVKLPSMGQMELFHHLRYVRTFYYANK